MTIKSVEISSYFPEVSNSAISFYLTLTLSSSSSSSCRLCISFKRLRESLVAFHRRLYFNFIFMFLEAHFGVKKKGRGQQRSQREEQKKVKKAHHIDDEEEEKKLKKAEKGRIFNSQKSI